MNDDRLSWLAMQYVLGELSESDRDAFEDRLAQDIVACEAVASASRLRLSLHHALAETEPVAAVSVVAASPNRRRSWLAIGTAISAVACLIVGVIFWQSQSIDPGMTRVPVGTQFNPDAVELVSFWRTEETAVVDLDLDEGDEVPQDDSDDDEIPGWLLAGVSLEHNAAAINPPQVLKDY